MRISIDLTTEKLEANRFLISNTDDISGELGIHGRIEGTTRPTTRPTPEQFSGAINFGAASSAAANAVGNQDQQRLATLNSGGLYSENKYQSKHESATNSK